MTGFLIWLLTVVVATYVGVVAVMFVFQRQMTYHPAGEMETPAAMGVGEMAPARVATADGLRLLSWYAPPGHPDAPVVVYCHGNSGNLGMRAFKARLFLDAGYGVLLVGYRGFNGNPGRPSEAGLYEDARAARRWLAEQGIAPDRHVLYGESLGTGVAVQLAVELAPAAVVLESPFTSLPDVAAGIYPLVPVRLLMLDRYDSLSKIGRLAAPLLVAHGERDRLVPFALGRRLFEAAPEPKQALFLAQAHHDNLYDWGVGRAIVAFLAGLTPKVSAPVPK